jgi:hypothetical protein
MTEKDRSTPCDRRDHWLTRRELLRWGLLSAASAWAVRPAALAGRAVAAVSDTAAPSLARSEEALRALIVRHARATDDPWAVMHGIRALGKGFSVGSGPAVEYLCSHELQEKSLRGGRYLFMPEKVEGHPNTFLKTLLEAGVSLDHPITAAGRQRTVADLLHGAKQLFVFDTAKVPNSGDHLPWSIIAFAITTQPGQDVWKNAEGQEIRLREVVEYAFSTAEQASAEFRKAMEKGVTPTWKDRISNFTCGGTHLIYSLAVAVRYGYLGEAGRRRFADQLRLLTWRLKVDLLLLDQYYEMVAKTYPTKTEAWRPYQLDSRLKFIGHSLEILSYVRLFKLATLTPEQERQARAAERTLAETILAIGKLDLAPLKSRNRKLFDLVVGDACHAYHGIHMVRGLNQI